MQQIIGRMASLVIFAFLVTLVFPSSLRAQNDAAKVFKANCTLCHGEDGGANTPTGKAWLKARDLKIGRSAKANRCRARRRHRQRAQQDACIRHEIFSRYDQITRGLHPHTS